MKSYKQQLETFLLKVAYHLVRTYWQIFKPITLGVRVLAMRDGQVLLVRHTYQKAWYLPGGGVKRGESAEQAIHREACEECGATLSGLHVLDVAYQPFHHKHDHVVYYLADCVAIDPQRQISREIEKFAFFPLDQLPPDTALGSRKQIEAYRSSSVAGPGRGPEVEHLSSSGSSSEFS